MIKISSVRRITAVGAIAIAPTAVAACSSSDVPPASPTTVDAPASEKTLEFQRCLSDAGWETKIVDDGLEMPDGIPNDQFPAYQEAVATCDAKINPNPISSDEFTDEQWTTLYNLETETAECLRGQGYDIPPIPTKQNYVDQYATDPWLAYAFIGVPDQGELTRLKTICPQAHL